MQPCGTNTAKSRDILSRPLLYFTLFWLPAVAIIITGNSAFRGGWRTIVWPAALGIMGATCLANAVRCGRVHCYITGPFFLAMAIVSLLYGLNVLPLGGNGWQIIGLTILVGAIIFCCLPELIYGKYRRGREERVDHT
jgi:hypothetical protein